MNTHNQIISNLLSAIKRTDLSLAALKADRAYIESKYHPVKLARSQFNSWRDSHEGKRFKKELYNRQKGRCANPNCQLKDSKEGLPIDYFEIDHKLPISSDPDLA